MAHRLDLLVAWRYHPNFNINNLNHWAKFVCEGQPTSPAVVERQKDQFEGILRYKRKGVSCQSLQPCNGFPVTWSSSEIVSYIRHALWSWRSTSTESPRWKKRRKGTMKRLYTMLDSLSIYNDPTRYIWDIFNNWGVQNVIVGDNPAKFTELTWWMILWSHTNWLPALELNISVSNIMEPLHDNWDVILLSLWICIRGHPFSYGRELCCAYLVYLF